MPKRLEGTAVEFAAVLAVRTVRLHGGITLSYCARGPADDVAVVLLPGPTDSWRSYEPVLRSLPERLPVLAVSLRGHGDSSKPRSGYRIEDLASDVVPFLDALGIERVVLAGHSGSCLVARRVALDNPNQIAGLFLEASPTTLRRDEMLVEFVDDVVAGLSDPVDRDFARSFIVDTSSDDLAADLIDNLVDELVKVPVVAWAEMFGSLLEYDDTNELSQLPSPAMLVWGELDNVVSRAMQDQLVSLLTRAELVVYADAGHTPRWEQPQRFADDLAAFGSRVLGL